MTFREWLSEEIKSAKETIGENNVSGGDRNSYGAGYDSGFLAGLQAAEQYFTDD